MFVNSDFSDLLRLFNANQVKYLVIGGYALIQYAEPRYTKDLDLWISTDAPNAKAVYRALREFGAPLADLTEADFSQEGYFYQMGVPPVRVDILMGIPGVVFEEAWPRRTEVDFDGLLVPFISRQDLITAKRAAGRPQDLLDVELLSQSAAKPKRRPTKPGIFSILGGNRAVAGLLTEPPWLGQETGHSHPGLLRGYQARTSQSRVSSAGVKRGGAQPAGGQPRCGATGLPLLPSFDELRACPFAAPLDVTPR